MSKHTPGKWKTVSHPILAGKHPLHDNRYIMTADAEIELHVDPNKWDARNCSDWDLPWHLTKGTIVCEMTDLPNQAYFASLIAAAPEMYEALKAIMEYADNRTPIRPGSEVLTNIAALLVRIEGGK